MIFFGDYATKEFLPKYTSTSVEVIARIQDVKYLKDKFNVSTVIPLPQYKPVLRYTTRLDENANSKPRSLTVYLAGPKNEYLNMLYKQHFCKEGIPKKMNISQEVGLLEVLLNNPHLDNDLWEKRLKRYIMLLNFNTMEKRRFDTDDKTREFYRNEMYNLALMCPDIEKVPVKFKWTYGNDARHILKAMTSMNKPLYHDLMYNSMNIIGPVDLVKWARLSPASKTEACLELTRAIMTTEYIYPYMRRERVTVDEVEKYVFQFYMKKALLNISTQTVIKPVNNYIKRHYFNIKNCFNLNEYKTKLKGFLNG
jgi:hypothetical protein